jgi:peptidoglycan/xylan/chitin deacetylase (PgdA/CDA1 family)
MRFISSILKRVVYPCLSRTRYLSHYSRKGELAVVTYHGVVPAGYQVTDLWLDGSWVTAESFRSQLRFLRSRYNVVLPEQVRLWSRGEDTLPERAVLLTCDDGLANAVTDMLPILHEEGLSCLFFVTSQSLAAGAFMQWYEELYLTLLDLPEGLLEGTFVGVPLRTHLNCVVPQRQSSWRIIVDALSQSEAPVRRGIAKAIRTRYGFSDDWASRYLDRDASRFQLLTLPQIRQLLAAGMAIGSHTESHPKLSQLPEDLSWREITESRSQLEAALGVRVWSIAYPFGGVDDVSARELQIAKKAGYDCAFINFAGGFGSALPRFALPRVHIAMDMPLSELEAHVSGIYEALRRHFGLAKQIPAARAGNTVRA